MALASAALAPRPAPASGPARPWPTPASRETDEAVDRPTAPALIFGTVAAAYASAVCAAVSYLTWLPAQALL